MSLNLEEYAKSIAKNMRIGQKPNPNIARARKKYGPIIDKLLSKKEHKLGDFTAGEQAKLKQLMGLEYGPLAYQKGEKIFPKPVVGEAVRVKYTEDDKRCVQLAKLVQEECWRLGAHASIQPVSDADAKRELQLSKEESLVELPPLSEAIAENIDATIFIGYDQDPYWSSGLEEKLLLTSSASMRMHEILDKRRVRWCLAGYPAEMKSDAYEIPKEEYELIFMDSIKETFSDEVKRLCDYYRKSLEGGDIVRIKAEDGTDLSFSIKGRPILVADGVIDDNDMEKGDVGLNIPDGEVFLAPLEHSANGQILFDYVSISGMGLVRDIRLTFKEGKATAWEGDKRSEEIFGKFLDSNTGEKDRIAELGIGTNPKAKFTGATLIDEKIFGSIHIAIGNNQGAYHGKNKASSHQDMIKLMHKGTMSVDGKEVMRNGNPIQ